MKLTIELDRETDGRWIAEVPELNVLIYGAGETRRFEKRRPLRWKSSPTGFSADQSAARLRSAFADRMAS